jgi:hypothetical protein
MSFVDQTVQDNSDIASSYIAGRSVENRLLKVIVLKPFTTSTRSLWIGIIIFLDRIFIKI